MKKIVLAIYTLMFVFAAYAQDSTVHMNFRGIPIMGTIDSFSNELEKLGYKEISKETDQTRFEGLFTGENVQLIVSYSRKTKTVWRVDVRFGKPTSWDELKGKFYNYRSKFTGKYGKPKYTSENFAHTVAPGEELAAVFHGLRCFYEAIYYVDGGTIWLYIPETGLGVAYTDDEGTKLAQRESKETPQVNNDF